uniref:Uncharacterized protein n=1 Tax=Rhizophora mucronata TaxID=61149 RepID=A0A2P2NN28_RHIMU
MSLHEPNPNFHREYYPQLDFSHRLWCTTTLLEVLAGCHMEF